MFEDIIKPKEEYIVVDFTKSIFKEEYCSVCGVANCHGDIPENLKLCMKVLDKK